MGTKKRYRRELVNDDYIQVKEITQQSIFWYW